MLISLKVSSLACKYVFDKSEHNAKGVPHRNEFWWSWNLEICQRIELKEKIKNGVICLVMMSSTGVTVIEMSEMDHFVCIFCWWQQKVSLSLGKYLDASKKSYLGLS